MTDWTYNYEYSAAWAATDDPRVFAVIERDCDPHAPDGDAQAPAYYVDYRRGAADRAGTVYHDDASDWLAQRYMQARDHFRYAAGYRYDGLPAGVALKAGEMLERWLRIFYDATAEEVRTVYDTVLILNTPEFRKHVGIESNDAAAIAGEVDEWQAYLDGDVYGIGYGVIEGRVMDDGEPVDVDDMDIEMTCWGFYGEEWAKEAALEFGHGGPDLHPMLPVADGVMSA